MINVGLSFRNIYVHTSNFAPTARAISARKRRASKPKVLAPEYASKAVMMNLDEMDKWT